jgi:xanthine dehydrogenase accessory factor
MLFGDRLVVVRGGGDLGSGAVHRLHRAGFPVVVLELDRPLAIRRTVTFAPAATIGRTEVEGIVAERVESADRALAAARTGTVAVMVDPDLPVFPRPIDVLVDARMAKVNLGTTIDQAGLVIGLGPGFTAGVDCHAVVETMRGHRLGRVVWEGSATPNTGIPGRVGGADAERVVRAPVAGTVRWDVAIGDMVEAGRVLGAVDDILVETPISGVVRGLIEPQHVPAGTKIGDVDPRGDRSACFEVSDKARLVGSGVLEATLVWLGRSGS